MKTLASQLICFATALIVLGLGNYWGNGLTSFIGLALLILNWIIGSMAWMLNSKEDSIADLTKTFRQ
jgi:hypothetical protein